MGNSIMKCAVTVSQWHLTLFAEEGLLVSHNLLAPRRYGVAVALVRVVLVIEMEGVHVMILRASICISL